MGGYGRGGLKTCFTGAFSLKKRRQIHNRLCLLSTKKKSMLNSLLF
jgi:hypothetical protein